jgi:hypothetical protein
MALSFRAMFVPERAADAELKLALVTPRDRFLVTVADGTIKVERADSEAAHARIEGEAGTVTGYIYGLIEGDPEADGLIAIAGDRGTVERFRGMVALPPKVR